MSAASALFSAAPLSRRAAADLFASALARSAQNTAELAASFQHKPAGAQAARCVHTSCSSAAAPRSQKEQDKPKQKSSEARKFDPSTIRVQYDPDTPLNEGGKDRAPFIPPYIDKLTRIIMRHGEKEKARRIILDTSHALYNMTRPANPRPELVQRNPAFIKR